VADIKLSRLPDRTLVKLTINIRPDLKRALDDYATFYREQYGVEESIVELVPAMLASFLDSDRAFRRAQKR